MNLVLVGDEGPTEFDDDPAHQVDDHVQAAVVGGSVHAQERRREELAADKPDPGEDHHRQEDQFRQESVQVRWKRKRILFHALSYFI